MRIVPTTVLPVESRFVDMGAVMTSMWRTTTNSSYRNKSTLKREKESIHNGIVGCYSHYCLFYHYRLPFVCFMISPSVHVRLENVPSPLVVSDTMGIDSFVATKS